MASKAAIAIQAELDAAEQAAWRASLEARIAELEAAVAKLTAGDDPAPTRRKPKSAEVSP
jgi:uncharacterized protein YceH (UPF0502 family)